MLSSMQWSGDLTAAEMLQSWWAEGSGHWCWAGRDMGKSPQLILLDLQGPLLAARGQDAHTVRGQRGLLVSQRVCPAERGEFEPLLGLP